MNSTWFDLAHFFSSSPNEVCTDQTAASRCGRPRSKQSRHSSRVEGLNRISLHIHTKQQKRKKAVSNFFVFFFWSHLKKKKTIKVVAKQSISVFLLSASCVISMTNCKGTKINLLPIFLPESIKNNLQKRQICNPLLLP